VCPEGLRCAIARSGDFSVEFDEGGGLKNRRLAQRKSASGQVLISRTLSVYGEVAERLKRRFAKVADDFGTGLRSMISGLLLRTGLG